MTGEQERGIAQAPKAHKGGCVGDQARFMLVGLESSWERSSCVSLLQQPWKSHAGASIEPETLRESQARKEISY